MSSAARMMLVLTLKYIVGLSSGLPVGRVRTECAGRVPRHAAGRVCCRTRDAERIPRQLVLIVRVVLIVQYRGNGSGGASTWPRVRLLVRV
jgi:hypothetical protein